MRTLLLTLIAVFGVILVIAVLGPILGNGKVNDALLGTWVLGWTLIGICILLRYRN